MELLVCYRHPEDREIYITTTVNVAEPCIMRLVNRLADASDHNGNYEESYIWEKEILRSYLVGFLNKSFYDIRQVGVIFEPARSPKYVSEQLILVDYINDKRYRPYKERKEKK